MRHFVRLSLALAAVLVPASVASARVLLVGTYHGIRGQYHSLQPAVNAAKPDDWILVGPGDYKTTSVRAPHGAPTMPAGVLITKPGIYLRGMNRNTVIVDGTKPGSAPCSRAKSAQKFGPPSSKGPMGLNGIEVWKARNVWVQNLTVCNFLGGSSGDGATGNEIWWNGGAGSGKIGGHAFLGSYLNATNYYYAKHNGDRTAAMYGIFSSNWDGGTWDHTYASNFSDSGYYIGACQQQCNQTINDAWGQFSSLGYSGSNSGGKLIVEHSQFDHNQDGFDTNSQNGDNPPPQDGSCPKGVKKPVKDAVGCWVFMDNYVHDNNNPNVPRVGAAGGSPVGTGMSISGGRFDTIIHNRFVNNKAWGIIVVPSPDSGPPCTGGTPGGLGPGSCLFDSWGNGVLDNTFAHNGGYGKPSNGDIAWLNFESGHPTPCFHANHKPGGGAATTSPVDLQKIHPKCDGSRIKANTNGPFLTQILCATNTSLGGGPPKCPNGRYPQRTHVTMHALPGPSQLPTMPNACKGVPVNPWCPSKRGFTG